MQRWAGVLVALMLAVGVLGASIEPSGASTSGDTPATFTLTAGSLAISVPTTSVDLGSVPTGSVTLSGQLGSVTVTDTRGNAVATWTATVTATAFTTGGGTANETVAASNLAYSSGLPTATSGVGAFVPGVVATLASGGTAAAWTGGVGTNSATWNPTLTVTLPPGAVAGTYSGTITHSVA